MTVRGRALLPALIGLSLASPAPAAAHYELPEPKVTAARLFKLPASTRGCTRRTVLPVEVRQVPGLRLSGLAIGVGRFSAVIAGSSFSFYKVPLQKGKTIIVSLTATSVRRQAITMSRRYRTCAPPKPKRTSRPRRSTPTDSGSSELIVSEGGGED